MSTSFHYQLLDWYSLVAAVATQRVVGFVAIDFCSLHIQLMVLSSE